MHDLPHPALVRVTILFCALTALCEGLDLQAAGLAAAGIGVEMAPSPEQMANFFSAGTLGLFIGAVCGGRLADSIGRKAVVVASVALFGVFSILTAAAWNIESLTAARFLTGLGLGGALPIMLAYVSETAAAERSQSSVTLVYAAMPFGGGVASLIGTMLVAGEWRAIFIVGGVLPLLVALAMMFYLKESIGFRAVDRTASRGSFAAIFADGRTLRTLLLWVSFFLALLLLYLLLNWLPTLMVGNGLTRTQAAGAQVGFNVGGAVASILIGRLIEGRLRTPSVLAVNVAIPVLLVLLAKAPVSLALSVLIVFLLGSAVVSAQAFLYTIATSVYPIIIRGVGVGSAVAMGRIGSIVGPKLGGVLKQGGHSPAQVFLDLLPLVIIGGLCSLWLAWLTRRPGALPS